MVDVVCLGILVADVIAQPVDELPYGAVSLMDEISLRGGGCALAGEAGPDDQDVVLGHRDCNLSTVRPS